MGRPKGSKNKAQQEITVTKTYQDIEEEAVKQVVERDEKNEFQLDIPQVTKIANLRGYISDFTGKTYSDAKKQASEWMKQRGYKMENYFEQKAYPGILVGYTVK